MNKSFFLITLLLLVFLLTGWIYYVNSQSDQIEPVEKISAKWWGSAHADIEAEAFTHWNEDEPAIVPPTCAKCHSGQGFLDYVGQDGSAEFVADEPAMVESVISCETCHNQKTTQLTSVVFPSGIEIDFDPNSALCASCHSGMGSSNSIPGRNGDIDVDAIIPDGSFINPHYAFAAATWLGSDAQGGYEYNQKTYVGKFEHAVGVQTCTQCHDPHSLHMNQTYTDVDLCSTCHSNVVDYSDYRDVYVDGVDYDADGHIEGIYYEIEGVRGQLNQVMQIYAAEIIGQGIGWVDQYPYLFKDNDLDGTISEEEMDFSNAYTQFTPRLMRTAYNLQFSIKDPAGYVHNGKYILQLLIDSIEDLASVVEFPFDYSQRP